MDRPARKTKSINYCESRDLDDDDEDFACVKPPPGKKLKHQEPRNTPSQESNKSRKALEQKLMTRDLEAAITLSLLNNINTDETKVAPPAGHADENTDPADLRRSNCSVDSSLLGLDKISEERHRKHPQDDDDYEPKRTQVSDSESEEDISEDEEFTVKKKSQKKKESDHHKPHKRSGSKKERQPPKLKAQPRTASAPHPAPTPRSPPTLKPAVSKPPVSVSPTGSRIPKWTPPGQIGKSPPSSQSTPARSPGQGLRLGLSRRVRVKPLHPSNAAT
ncbi:RAD51-associated protein 1 isoform X2 [Hippocampus comes]|uniref:RAD51 associated protein 1 n=1 Tax=Hippocampus comes TaxID=109280 RepID=A0A3Q3D8N4_HIPCM|nr:PREDICTED: RAD51-associated protein 1 isoform X2 [Hippocampus comes]